MRSDGGAAWIASVALAIALSATCDAEAQVMTRDVHDLARTLIAEADGHRADWRPILAALQARADRHGAPIAAVARRYSRIHRAIRPTPRMREILALPDALPSRRRGQWSAALVVVDAWLRGDRSHPCASTPTHFGDRRGDAARAARARWIHVDCGQTANAFWRGP